MAYTTIDNPELYFQTKLYTGTGSSNDITLDGSENMQPDWVWIKRRNSAGGNMITDSVRGATKTLITNETSAEQTFSNGLTAFGSDGFTVGSESGFNNSSDTFVAWNWKAGGTAPTQTYTVKVVSDSGNKYRFDDFGTSAVTLDLQEGGTYTFDQSDSSNSGHPLRFSTTSDGSHGGGSEFTTNVTTTGTPGSSGAKTVITLGSGVATLYYYCTQHSGMGGQANTNSTFGSSNFAGGIQSVVSASTESGFSVVSYTGTGSASTVGHNLGTTPSMVWIFNRTDTGNNAHVFHKALGSTQYFLHASTLGAQTYAPVGIGSLTSSTFSVGTVGGVNGSGKNYLAYVFADVKGFSKIDSYTGNANADGTFIYTGFRVSWVMFKPNTSADWTIVDAKRNTSNVVKDKTINVNLSSAEHDGGMDLDFLSNGFKIRNANTDNNHSGTIIYMAFAESPFVNSNGLPTNAR